MTVAPALSSVLCLTTNAVCSLSFHCFLVAPSNQPFLPEHFSSCSERLELRQVWHALTCPGYRNLGIHGGTDTPVTPSRGSNMLRGGAFVPRGPMARETSDAAERVSEHTDDGDACAASLLDMAV